METGTHGPVWLLIMQLQSNSRKVMQRKKGMYSRANRPMLQLNASAPPLRVKSSNESSMSRMKSKAFSAGRRASRSPVNQSKVAVAKSTSGRPGAGRTVAGKGSGMNTSRVMQISPAQRGGQRGPTSKTVAKNPKGQNKSPSLHNFRKSIRKTMGYS